MQDAVWVRSEDFAGDSLAEFGDDADFCCTMGAGGEDRLIC